MIRIRLAPHELYRACAVGLERHCSALENGRRGTAEQNLEKSSIGNQIGAMGELALSLHTGIPWTAATDHRPDSGPDVGPYEVKTRPPQWSDAIIRPHELVLERVYVAVAADIDRGTCDLMGWIWGASVGRYAPWTPNKRPKAHFVPYADLGAMERLPAPPR